MLLRYFFISLLLFSNFAIGQILESSRFYVIDKELQQIDTLIYYNQFVEASLKADSLASIYSESEDADFLPYLLKLKYLQGVILDEQNEHGSALPIFMEALKEIETTNLYYLRCKTYIRIAYNLEKSSNYYNAYKYLNKALSLAIKYNYSELLSSIYLRLSMSHRFLGDPTYEHDLADVIANDVPLELFSIDSAFYYANEAVDLATKYNNENDVSNGYLALGILENNQRKDYAKAIEYLQKAIPYLQKTKNYESIGLTYTNIAIFKARLNDFEASLSYSDSAYVYEKDISVYYKWYFLQMRSYCFEKADMIDSAFIYYKQAYQAQLEYFEREDLLKTKHITEQYDLDKKEAIITGQKKQMFLVFCILGIIIVATALLFYQYRKIRSRNKIINIQLIKLSKALEQKQILLAELQHRVKNNLQHVISILEIQKESVTFNNIGELVRGNQNRIHSMALLHQKLDVVDFVNDVDFKRYITELAELVKDSYETDEKKISLNVNCEIEQMSIEKALPVGLIITELVSNSMKHAFTNQKNGTINIHISKDNILNKLHYKDSGIGFDFYKTSEKGLGQEIIKGLIDQLDGKIESNKNKGFELILFFN